jgi:hypothetical protein
MDGGCRVAHRCWRSPHEANDWVNKDRAIQAETLLRRLEQHPFRLFGFFLLLNTLLLWPTLLNQPVWDEAFSIFPAADFLAQHGFDYAALLRQPGFLEGGPTTHGFTLPAFYTALVLKLTGGGKAAWCILHAWQWLLGAGIATLLVRMLSSTHGLVTSFLVAALSLYCPLMLAQLGNMYLEVPLLFFCLLALYLFLRNRILAAAAAGMIACATKESGLIAGIALAMTAFLTEKPSWKNLRTSMILLLPSVAVVLFLHLCQSGTAGGLAAQQEPVLVRCWLFLVQAFKKYLAMMPDMLALFVATTAIGCFQFIKITWRVQRRKPATEDPTRERLTFFCSLLVIGFVGFHFVVWAVFANLSNFASRYLSLILPAMWILADVALSSGFAGRKGKEWLLAGTLVVLLINRYGMFYPALVTSDIGVAERSCENLDGFRVQKDYMRFIEREIPSTVPIFHGLPEAYLGQYPVLGYVTKPLTNGVLVTRYTRNRPATLGRFPDRFYIMYFFPIVGSDQLLAVYHEAEKNPEWRTEDVASFVRGDFKAFLVLLERKQQ